MQATRIANSAGDGCCRRARKVEGMDEQQWIANTFGATIRFYATVLP